jgi:hypothetical protein
MIITRNFEGETRRLDAIEPSMLERIEQLGELNDRRERYKVAGDWESLLKLADEYEQRLVVGMAAMIRREAEEHGAKGLRGKSAIILKTKPTPTQGKS